MNQITQLHRSVIEILEETGLINGCLVNILDYKQLIDVIISVTVAIF